MGDINEQLWRAAQQITSLRERVKVLEQAVQHYEAALKARWPEGAMGESFGHWNSARAALEITPHPSPSPRS